MSASEVVSEIRALIAAGKTDAEIYAFIKQPLIGKPAPDFNVAESLLPNKEFANIGLDTYKGQWKVLLWYPLDFTFGESQPHDKPLVCRSHNTDLPLLSP